MNRFIVYALALALGAAGDILAYAWNNPTGGSLPAGCRHATFYSNANQTTIGFIVYLPPDYDASPSVRYPVVYSLHGMGGDEWGNLAYATALQSNIQSKAVAPMIMVFVNGRGNTFYADSKDGSVKCETSIIRELIPHVDSAYRTLPDRGHRAVNGISMGGFGALMLAFKHPDLFGHAASDIAALVNWDTLSAQQFDQTIPTQIFGGDSSYFNSNYYPFTFVKKNADTLKAMGMKVHMADNPNDVTMGPLWAYNLAMRNLLKTTGIPVEFDSAAGSGHSADFTGPSGVAILKFHSASFAAATVSLRPPGSARGLSEGSARLFFRGAGASAIPGRWRSLGRDAALFSLLGRDMGRLSRQGGASHDERPSDTRSGAGILIAKPSP